MQLIAQQIAVLAIRHPVDVLHDERTRMNSSEHPIEFSIKVVDRLVGRTPVL